MSKMTYSSSGTSGVAMLEGPNDFDTCPTVNGYEIVTEDSSGKIAGSKMPSLALTETYVVSSESAMLALSAQPGDVAVRTDQQRSYILATSPASTLGNWVELLVNGFTPTLKTSNYTAAYGEIVLADATSGALTIQLPTADETGREVRIKKIDSSSNTVTASPASGTIDGSATAPITVQWAALTLVSDGTNWYVI